jgi:hypothetical protein
VTRHEAGATESADDVPATPRQSSSVLTPHVAADSLDPIVTLLSRMVSGRWVAALNLIDRALALRIHELPPESTSASIAPTAASTIRVSVANERGRTYQLTIDQHATVLQLKRHLERLGLGGVRKQKLVFVHHAVPADSASLHSALATQPPETPILLVIQRPGAAASVASSTSSSKAKPSDAIVCIDQQMANQLTTTPPLASASSHLQLWRQRAECAYRVDEYRSALTDCQRVLTCNPADVDVQILQVMCLLGLRQYAEAKQIIIQLMTRFGADTSQSTADSVSAPGRAASVLNASPHSSSSSSSSTLTSSNPYSHLLRLFRRIEDERSGIYDVVAMEDEAFSLLMPKDREHAHMRHTRSIPCVRLSPHGEYVHPAVECAVSMPGKGRGTRVATSNPPGSAHDSRSMISADSLLMCCKAVAVWLKSDDVSKSDLLIRKLQDQPHLIDQVERLFGDPSLEEQRAQLLTHRSAMAAWHSTSSSSSISTVDLAHQRMRDRLTATLSCNPFGDSLSSHDESFGIGGGGLWFLPSFFNHSCVPNCAWTMRGDYIFVRAIRDLHLGEELTIPYYPLMSKDFRRRQAKIQAVWHFTCECKYCNMFQRQPRFIETERVLMSDTQRITEEWYQMQRTAPSNVRRLALLDRLQHVIDTYRAQIQKAAHNFPLHPMLIRLRSPLSQLTDMLRAILTSVTPFAPPADRHSVLRRHWDACVERAKIESTFVGCASADFSDAILDALHMQQRGGLDSPVSRVDQVSLMAEWMHRVPAAHGDDNVHALHEQYAHALLEKKLEQLWQQVAPEGEVKKQRTRA